MLICSLFFQFETIQETAYFILALNYLPYSFAAFCFFLFSAVMEKTNSNSSSSNNNNNSTIQNSHNNSVSNNSGGNSSNTTEKSSNQSDQLSGGWERVSEELSDSQVLGFSFESNYLFEFFQLSS